MNMAGVSSASMFTREAAGGCAARGFPIEALFALRPTGHDDLAVDQAWLGQQLGERRDELGKVAGERLGAAAADLDVGAVPTR